jgi:hypothetical protein
MGSVLVSEVGYSEIFCGSQTKSASFHILWKTSLTILLPFYVALHAATGRNLRAWCLVSVSEGKGLGDDNGQLQWGLQTSALDANCK